MSRPSTPPRVLFAAANPTRDLSSEEEFRRVRAVLMRIKDIQLHPVLCATIDEFHGELIDRDFDYVHLVAHGRVGEVTLMEQSGSPWGREVPAQQVIELLEHQPTLQCVVLNACNSAAWVSKPLGPALVTMRGAIGDDAALEFSEAFYRAIAAGRTPEFAFEHGQIRARRNAPHADFRPELWPACRGVIGIRARQQYKDDNDLRCQYLCDLGAHFPSGGRVDWAAAVAELEAFFDSPGLRRQLAQGECLLSLDCPPELAFLIGRKLGAHANAYPLQNRPARRLWRPDRSAPAPHSSPWTTSEFSCIGARKLVISISVACDVRPLVRRHLEQIGQPVHWVDFSPVQGAHQHSVHDADHASALASTLVQQLPHLRVKYGCSEIDLFCAAPNGLMFFLGQQGSGLGKLNLHGFIRGEERYELSLSTMS